MDQHETVKTPPGAGATASPSEGPAEAAPAPGEARARTHVRLIAWARANPLLATAIVVGLVARIVFWAVTDRKLDDALITIKFDKNLADGFGLVHNLGDGHVQGFTSALSVLVPMPGELITSGGGFALMRLASLAAFVLAAIYAYRIARELRLGPWPIGFLLAYLALDQNQVFFGMAGMETQIAVAVLLAGIYYVMVEDYTKSGVALGLALLARPDFVLWVAPALLFLLIRNWRRGLESGLIAGLVAAPWVIFTTLYYGSPIPNTIPAKNLAFGPNLPSFLHIGAWISFLGHQFSAHVHDWKTFAPFYEAAFLSHAPLPYTLLKVIAFVVAALAIVGAITTWSRPGFRPAIALLLLFILYKVIFLTIGYFEWYGPPAVAVLMLLAAAGLDRVARLLARVGSRRVVLAALAGTATVLGLVYSIPLAYRTIAEARVQHDIEDRVRAPLGEYLGRVVKPGQSLTSESSGYVGYDTNGTLYDYPGLESKSVVNVMRAAGAGSAPPLQGPDTLLGVVRLMHPDWVVMRPWEAAAFRANDPAIARRYRKVREFKVSAASSSLDVGGFDLFNVDRDFVVFRREPHLRSATSSRANS